MTEWLLQLIPIPRLELVLLFISVLIFGIIGGIGWILLWAQIQPMRLSHYLSLVVTSILKYWFNNQEKQDQPIGNPNDDTKEIKDAFIRSEAWPLRPVPRPDDSGSGGAKQEQGNTPNSLSHAGTLTQEQTNGQPKTNGTQVHLPITHGWEVTTRLGGT